MELDKIDIGRRQQSLGQIERHGDHGWPGEFRNPETQIDVGSNEVNLSNPAPFAQFRNLDFDIRPREKCLPGSRFKS